MQLPVTSPRAREVMASIRDGYKQALVPGLPTALLDFPDHSNVGDSAIWAGEVVALREAECDLRYVCDVDSFSEAVLRRRMSFGQILLHGGGNFGTVWPRYQAFRETVVQRFPDFRVVQLPQSLHFNDEAVLSRTRRRLSAHPDFLLMVRDRRSESLAREQLNVSALLCPDSALLLHGSLHRMPSSVDVLVLARTDKEAQGRGLHSFSLSGHSVMVVDWLEEDVTSLMRMTSLMKRLGKSWLGNFGRVQQAKRIAFRALANERVSRGVEMLSRGRVVVTDRLHAHIICMMLGIPHVVLDNNYGKLGEFIDCWHDGDPLVRRVATAEAAQREVLALLNELGPAAASAQQ